MPDDEHVDPDAVALDAGAIDDALAAFEEACAQLVQAASDAASRPPAGRHLAAVRERLAAVSVPVTSSTADALVLFAADARAALQRVLAAGGGEEDDEDLDVEDPDGGDGDRPERASRPDPDEELPESDPVLDLAPDPPEAPEVPPAPSGYRACTSLPTRGLPHVLAYDDGRWQRASIVYAPDDTLMVRTATARTGLGLPLDRYRPAQIARPHARG